MHSRSTFSGLRFAALSLLLLLAACEKPPAVAPPTDTVEYQGETIHLRKPYDSFEAYQNDPNKLDPAEISHIEQLLLAATMPAEVANYGAAITAARSIQFPGYGMTVHDSVKAADGAVIDMIDIEIPQREKNRVFVYRASDGAPKMIEDFVLNTSRSALGSVKAEGRTLIFLDQTGRELTRRMY